MLMDVVVGQFEHAVIQELRRAGFMYIAIIVRAWNGQWECATWGHVGIWGAFAKLSRCSYTASLNKATVVW